MIDIKTQKTLDAFRASSRKKNLQNRSTRGLLFYTIFERRAGIGLKLKLIVNRKQKSSFKLSSCKMAKENRAGC